MSIDYKLIGSRIQKARKSKGVTQDNLADVLDVTVGYISQIERGITKISLEKVVEISNILDCDIGYMITGSSTNSNDYMNNELFNELSSLSSNDKELVCNIIKAIQEYKTKL